MPNEEIASLFQAIMKPVNQCSLGRLIKINHDVSTKDGIKHETRRRLFHEIESPEFYRVPQILFNPIGAHPATQTDLKIFS
jgi:hypothetical protein